LLSDAGCPSVADPGSLLVALAHKYSIRVVPYVGPNSILLALMGSGFNGQQFKFNGYLPVKNPDLSKTIKRLEQEMLSSTCTQLFIEAPYRNRQLLEALCNICSAETKLCIAFNLTASSEFIVTKPIKYWRGNVPDFNKQPAVFALGI
jgi:16S rRNA (cytidine1402-2'-O)-methyltransferase